METVIELKDISKRFNEVQAVVDFNLKIDKGEIVSLLGPSGCGKTTTLRMIAGFEIPDEGQILLNGKDIVNLPVRSRNMGMIFQNYALFPHMTVFENIAFGLQVRKTDKNIVKQKVEEYLALVKLTGLNERKPSQLSGGQQQRVALARALITQPEVLLMDEPFGALDKKLRESMQLEIKNVLRKLSITAIFVTHDQEEALVLSDRVVVMNSGTIEQIGSPENLYEKPKTHFVANFIGVSNIFRGMVQYDKEKYIDLNGKKLLLGEAAAGEGVFALRPEKLKLSSDRLDEENCFEGIVENVKYFGMTSQYYIDMGLDEPVIANCQNTGEGGQAYHAGDKVYVAIDKRNILQVN